MNGQQWQGKKWYCYGTSMTDNQCIVCGAVTGQYSRFLAEHAGLEEHNFGKGGSGIVPALHGDDNVKSRVMTLEDGKQEADLITVEVIPNDMQAEVGEITDWSDDTFCGNLNQILAYLQENTNATLAVLIATRTRYESGKPDDRTYPTGERGLKWLAWEETVEKISRMHGIPCWNGAAEANLGYFRMGTGTEYVQDQIHLTEKGGRILADYYWGKLQTLYPVR